MSRPLCFVALVSLLGGCASSEHVSPEVTPFATQALHSVSGLVAYLEASGVEVEDYHVREYGIGFTPITDLMDSTAVISFEYKVDYTGQFIYPNPSSYSHFPICFVRVFESAAARSNESWRFRSAGETYTRRTPSLLADDFVTVRRRYAPPPVQIGRFIVDCSDEGPHVRKALLRLEAYAESSG